jgi:hypothetical protein
MGGLRTTVMDWNCRTINLCGTFLRVPANVLNRECRAPRFALLTVGTGVDDFERRGHQRNGSLRKGQVYETWEVERKLSFASHCHLTLVLPFHGLCGNRDHAFPSSG